MHTVIKQITGLSEETVQSLAQTCGCTAERNRETTDEYRITGQSCDDILRMGHMIGVAHASKLMRDSITRYSEEEKGHMDAVWMLHDFGFRGENPEGANSHESHLIQLS